MGPWCLYLLNAKKKLLMWPWCLCLRGWGCQKGIWRVWSVSGLANGRLERQEKAIDVPWCLFACGVGGKLLMWPWCLCLRGWGSQVPQTLLAEVGCHWCRGKRRMPVVPWQATKEPSSMVPGAAPALAKAGVGVYTWSATPARH